MLVSLGARAWAGSWLVAAVALGLGLSACPDEGTNAAADAASVHVAVDLGSTPDGAVDTTPTLVPTPVAIPVPIVGTRVLLGFDRSQGFFSAPVPSADLRAPDGGVDISGWPNADAVEFIAELKKLARDIQGFGTTSTILIPLDGPLDVASLPDLHGSIDTDASVFVIGSDGTRYPIEVRFTADGGPFGTPNLLSLLPLQGIPLAAGELHVAVVTRDVRDEAGEPLGVSLSLAELLAGVPGPEWPAAYVEAVALLKAQGVEVERVAGLAAFRTQEPVAELRAYRDAVLARPRPTPDGPFALSEVYDGFCVYASTLTMPVYQAGEPPFTYPDEGGGWADTVQAEETARIFVTVPRQPPPAGGYPTVVFVRTGGGGDRPLIDRGVRAEPGGSTEPGSGPAGEFARVGFAGVSVDGPHGGLRNVTGGDEQFLMFNVANPVAMRDNVRQSALELMLVAHVLGDIVLDASDCQGVGGSVGFDSERLVLMGHSMGATIAPLVVAMEPAYRALILSGAGGSWTENVVHKLSPLPTRPLAELLLGYDRGTLTTHDPALMLLQWIGEAADPPVYGRHIVHEPLVGQARHVLMLQGIVDTYILPPIANATSLSFRLDLAGPIHDADHPELGAFRPLEGLLELVGRARVDLPIAGNVADQTTAVVVQHLQGPIEDGHEVVFQTEPPKIQYRRFLETFAAGAVPKVPAPASP